MADKSLAIQYKRQYADHIDTDFTLTSAEKAAYLTNPLRYPGQVCYDSTADSLFRMNNLRTAWIAIAAGSGHTILNSVNTVFTNRANLKFIGATVTDNAGNNSTDITIAAGVASVNGDSGPAVVLTSDNISEGTTNKYFTEGRVRSTVLTGLSLLSGGAITAADSILTALGKIQTQMTININRFQNSLLYDGTGLKFSSTDSINSAISRNAKLFSSTGITHKKDTVNLTPVDVSGVHSIDIAAVASAVFWNELFVVGQTTDDAIKSFPFKNYPVSQFGTATGGNINLNPITTDGLYVRYLGYNKLGNVVTSAADFSQNLDVAQLGFATLLRTGGVITFLGGATPGARNIFPQPLLASSLELDRTLVSLKSDIVIGYNSGTPTLKAAAGSITGLSINWKSAGNPNNDLPIDKTPYPGFATLTFASINPSFLTQTTPITPHTAWTELEPLVTGIAINNRFWNTATLAAGTLAANKFSVKRVLVGARGGMWLQDGEHATTAAYATLDEARSALSSHVFTDSIVPPGVVTEIARIVFKQGVTDFTNPAQFYITSTFSGGGGGGGGGGGTATFAGITGLPTDNTSLATELSNRALNLLTGFTVPGSVSAVASTDTVLQGIQKLEKRGTDNTTALANSITTDVLAAQQLLLSNTANWSTATTTSAPYYTGGTALSGNKQGQFFFDGVYYFYFIADDYPVRIPLNVVTLNEGLKITEGNTVDEPFFTDPDRTTSNQAMLKGNIYSVTETRTSTSGTAPGSTDFTYNYRPSGSSTWTNGVTLATLTSYLTGAHTSSSIITFVTATNTTTTVPACAVLTLKRYA